MKNIISGTVEYKKKTFRIPFVWIFACVVALCVRLCEWVSELVREEEFRGFSKIWPRLKPGGKRKWETIY